MSDDGITVYVGRDGSDALEATALDFETDGSFDVFVDNHDRPVHVHCRLDGDLAAVASIAQSNIYVESEERSTIPIRIPTGVDGITGTLELSTRYGAQSVSIDVVVAETSAGRDVSVDETLSQPSRNTPDPSVFGPLFDTVRNRTEVAPGTIAVVVLGVLALGVGLVTGAIVGGTVGIVGVLILTVGVLVSLALLY